MQKERMNQLRLQADEFARNFQDESFNRDTNDLVIGTDFIIPVVVHIPAQLTKISSLSDFCFTISNTFCI